MNLLGGILWLISTFLDRADGELARISGEMRKEEAEEREIEKRLLDLKRERYSECQ